jgi:3-keto-5-aminohexanoate cleavage enzyme
MEKAVLTCALTGVLTNPAQHPVPVTAAEMAAEARRAYEAGASIVHLHYRRQEPGQGHLPSWEPDVVAELTAAVRAACPAIVVNMSTGVVGPDVSGPLACLRRIRPELAACNAGTLNYLKTRSDGAWAWPPLVFDNPVEKVQAFLDAMREVGAVPELECFDLGIVRSVALYVEHGMLSRPHYNFVMGVASGMPADPELLPFLVRYTLPESPWQATVIGREEIWPVHRRAAELGGALRTGLEDTFFLPDGARARSNGELVEALARCAREAGREIATPAEARGWLGVGPRAA